jgi:hypothetical protein
MLYLLSYRPSPIGNIDPAYHAAFGRIRTSHVFTLL